MNHQRNMRMTPARNPTTVIMTNTVNSLSDVIVVVSNEVRNNAATERTPMPKLRNMGLGSNFGHF